MKTKHCLFLVCLALLVSCQPTPPVPLTPPAAPPALSPAAEMRPGVIVAVFFIRVGDSAEEQHTIVSLPDKMYVILGPIPEAKVGDFISNFMGRPAGVLPIYTPLKLDRIPRDESLPKMPPPAKGGSPSNLPSV